MSATGKKTGQICLREKPSVSDLESSSLAGFFALIWSNLCTRHILFGLKPRGHHDWPYKGVSRQVEVTGTLRAYFVSGSLHDNFRIAIRFRVPSNCHAQPDSPVAHAAGSEGGSFPCRNLDKLPAM